jgi:hypothetical protein
MRLLHDRLRLALGLLANVLRRALRGHQRRAQQLLDLAVPRDLVREVVDAVAQVHPLLPHPFVAVGDLGERAVDGGAAIAEQAPAEPDVANLDG